MCLQENKFLRAMRKNKQLFSLLVVAVIGSILITTYGVLSYFDYQDNLVQVEQSQLLAMANTIGRSLTNYIELEKEDLDFLTNILEVASSPEKTDTALNFFAENNDGLYNWLAIYKTDGTLLSHWGKSVSDSFVLPSEHLPTARLLGKSIEESGWYELYIARSVTILGEPCYLAGAIDLNHIYEVTVRPVKIGQGGYSVVKDKDLSIIMHHAKSQIGMDAVYDRSIQYPQLDLTDLKNWIDMQRNAPQGTSVIQSYIWDSPELTEQKRIVAYTTIDVLGDQWIVNSTLPYEELSNPLQLMMGRLLVMTGGMLFLLIAFSVSLMRYLTESESQRKEIAYLRRINEGMELLRRKEDELRHYQRVQSLGEMSSQIAHEFNNYLTPIMVFGEILEGDETLSADQKEYTHEILTAAERSAALSRRLLDFSRQDVGIQLKAMVLPEEVRKATDMIVQLTPKKIQLRVTLPEESFYYMGRDGEMEQLLMNLSSNAFHAMEQADKGCLQITLERIAEATGLPPSHMGWAELRVSDTGNGIPADALDKIFEPFYTTKRKGKGTGLGLAVVQNAVTASGGQIQVTSQVGQGTTFRLIFPLCAEKPHSDTSQKLTITQRMAIVDDDKALLRALRTQMDSKEFEVDIFSNPMEILSVVQREPQKYDLILLDVDMPEMSGLEAAGLLRSLTRDVALVLMSGRNSAEAEKLVQNGVAERFVSKEALHSFLDAI